MTTGLECVGVVWGHHKIDGFPSPNWKNVGALRDYYIQRFSRILLSRNKMCFSCTNLIILWGNLIILWGKIKTADKNLFHFVLVWLEVIIWSMDSLLQTEKMLRLWETTTEVLQDTTFRGKNVFLFYKFDYFVREFDYFVRENKGSW